MLHRPPRRLQQQPMLRVDQHGLPLRQPEKRRVESRYVIDEACPATHNLAGCVRIRVVQFVDIPTVRGNLRYRIPAFPQHIPELVRVGSARNAQRVADYRKTLDGRQSPFLEVGHLQSPISSSRFLSCFARARSSSTLSFRLTVNVRASSPSNRGLQTPPNSLARSESSAMIVDTRSIRSLTV